MGVTLLVYIAAGGLSLAVGYVALIAAKGAWVHRQSVVLFVYAMIVMGHMRRYSFLQLAAETERAFEFLGANGLHVYEIELVKPSFFRGGYVLRLVRLVTIALSCLELQREVVLNEYVNRSCALLRGTRKPTKEALQ